MPETYVDSMEDDLDIPPLDPDEELPDPDELDAVDRELLAETEEAAQATARSPRTPTKRSKRGKATPEVIDRQRIARDMTIDEWLSDADRRYGWDRPGVACQLHRHYPRYHNGVPTAGLVDTRKGGHFTVDEVKELHGGGEYEMQMHVPPEGPRRPPLVLRKKFEVSGVPKTPAAHPKEPSDGTVAAGGMHPTVERGLVGLMGKQMDRIWESANERGGGMGASADMRKPYEHAMGVMQSSYADQARVREESARAEAKMHESRATEARAEAEQARRELERAQVETAERVREAAASSNNILTALLPSFNDSASKQVEHIMRTFEAREARIEQGHMKEMEQTSRMHEAQLQQLQMVHHSEMARMEASLTTQLGMLQQQLEYYRLQTAGLQQENVKLRDDLMQQRMAQIEALKVDRDPMTKLSELQQLSDMAKDMLGAGGGGGEDDMEGAKPWMKLINNAINQFGPAVTAVVGQRGQPQPGQMMPGQPPGQMMMAPQQVQAMQAQQQVQAQMQQQQVQVQRPAGPPPEPPVRVKKSEIKELIGVMGNIFASGTPPEVAAAAALKHPDLDHRVLRVLTKKEPERVIEELDNASLLLGPIASPEGREYAIAVLRALRTSL